MKKIINISPIIILPPDYGGPIRVYNLNKNLKNRFDLKQYSLSRKNLNIKKTIFNNYKEEYFHLVSFSILAMPFWLLNLPHNFILDLSTKIEGLPKNIKNAIRECDYVQLETPFMINAVKKISKNKKIILDQQNVEYDLENDCLKNKNKFLRRIIMSYIKKLEKQALESCDVILAVSEEDKKRFIELYGIKASKIKIIPNGVDTEYYDQKIKSEHLYGGEFNNKIVISFLGGKHLPNQEAVQYLRENIAPHFESRNDVIFLVIGSVSNKKIEKNIIYTGKVDDIRPYLELSDLLINPMISGSGTHLKILEVMSFGIPIINTKKGARGLGIKNGKQTIICELTEFPKKILELTKNKSFCKKLIINSKKFVKKNYEWEKISNKLAKVYDELDNK